MKNITIYIFGFFLSLISIEAISQEAKINIREGNEAYKNNQFQQAEELYRQSLREDPDMVESTFNLGDALYRQEKYEDASRYFNMAAEKADDKETKAKAYHNLGNSYLKEKKLEESINAYKKSLLNNPKDEETRFNLAYAKQQLQQQQEQQKQDQEQEDQEKEEQEEQEQEQEQNQEQEEQEEQSEEEEQQQQEQQEQEEQQEEQQQQQQPEQVSREDAERILEALNNKEKEIQEDLKKKEGKQTDINIEKDW